MDDTTQYPEQDPDDKLAQSLGRHLESSSTSEPLAGEDEEPFVRVLLDYRAKVRGEIHLTENQSHQLWEPVGDSISGPTVMRLTRIRTLSRWAAGIAAAVVFVVGLYSWLGGSEEELLATTSSSIETVTLADGSSVTLRPHSSLTLIDPDEHRYRLEGEALFEVTHDPGREFVVETEFASVAVLGTRFDVSTWAGETQVYLVRGKVRVEHSSSSNSTILEPGQAAVADRNMISKPLSEATGSTYTDWLSEELSFDQTPTYRVAAELGHHYDVNLVVPAKLENETLSGRIILTSLEQGLEDLSTVLGGRFEPNGTDSFILVLE
jgi:transmembrane sensor